MANERLSLLGDYPFRRLSALLADATAPAGMMPLVMSIGEPQLPVPLLVPETVAAHAHLWNKYPPAAGTPELRAAICGFLARRYALPAGMLDPDRHVVPAPGTREALFQLGLAVVPEHRAGGPCACMPPADTTTCSGRARSPLRAATLAAIASRSAGMPALAT